jgi:tryptophan-rich sensory protein
MSPFEVLMLAASVVLCLAVGGIGGFFTGSAVKTWYPTLRKPKWNPPSWLFGPVWTLLYILMGIAAWMIWRDGRFGGFPGVAFGVQLILNLAWSWFFFGRRRPDWAFAEVVVLWLSILATTAAFWQADPVAGALFLPYLAWVTFASCLNGAIWRLNRTPS